MAKIDGLEYLISSACTWVAEDCIDISKLALQFPYLLYESNGKIIAEGKSSCSAVVDDSSTTYEDDAVTTTSSHVHTNASARIQNEIHSNEIKYDSDCRVTNVVNSYVDGNGNETVKAQFKCIDCGNNFRQNGQLALHRMREHAKHKSWKCDVCGRQFQQKAKLALHIRMHNGKKTFSCSICEKHFTGKGLLALHMKVHAIDTSPQCQICFKRFQRPGKLALHMKIHNIGRDRRVQHFSNVEKSELSSHTNELSSQLTHTCAVDVDLLSPQTVLDTHSKDCNLEQSSVPRKEFLSEEHMTGQKYLLNKRLKEKCGKRYRCNICNKRYPKESLLAIHLKEHDEKKSNKCKISKKEQFSRNPYLGSLNIEENNQVGLKCKTCHKVFFQKSRLALHMKLHSSTSCRCNVCHKEFRRDAQLALHMREHSFQMMDNKCKICSRQFRQVGQLALHLRNHALQ